MGLIWNSVPLLGLQPCPLKYCLMQCMCYIRRCSRPLDTVLYRELNFNLHPTVGKYLVLVVNILKVCEDICPILKGGQILSGGAVCLGNYVTLGYSE